MSALVLRLGGERVSVRVRPRPLAVSGLLAVAVLALAVVGLVIGDFPLAPGKVLAALVGGADAGARFIVTELRLPRVLCALLTGLALGVSGAIFQTLTRNPLGSPDVIGFQSGTVTGALVVITVLGGAGLQASAGALVGGISTAVAVYLLARRDGRLSSYRLVLVGIAIGALMIAVNDFLLTRARIEEAQEATRWLLGSLNGRTWEDTAPLLAALAVLLPLSVPAGRGLRALELGDELAAGLGVRVEHVRVALAGLAVALVAATTTAIGPVLFVALAAPQIARRLARTDGPPLLAAALTGALIVLASDIAAQRIVPGTPLPVGIVTGAVGGVYLVWLLASEWRAGHA